MHWFWQERRPRGCNPSRPRVSRAVEAAHLAQAGGGPGLGGASAGVAAFITPPLAAPVRRGGALGNAVALKLPPALIRESLRAAREAGRTLEEVWAEALGDWLTQNDSPGLSLEQHAGRVYKRQRVWGEIDETLRELRAS
jgi:hypothetical protein